MDIKEKYTDEMKSFVQDRLLEDPAQLLLAFSGKVNFDLKFAIQQIQARQKAKAKLPNWVSNLDLVFPAQLSVEQSSSEETAQFKAAILPPGEGMIDLTGGLGIDTFYLSEKFKKATYCERNPELFAISKHNLSLLSLDKFDFVQGDSLDFLKASNQQFDLIFVDPARRGLQNQKLYKLIDCEPNIIDNWQLLRQKALKVIIKASPLLDISEAVRQLSEVSRIIILSVKNEVKELLLIWDKENVHEELSLLSLDIREQEIKEFEMQASDEGEAKAEYGEAENFLIEPLAGILKAGAFKLFGSRFGLKKLHPNTHLYTCEQKPSNLPGKVFEIVKTLESPKSDLKKLIPAGMVNVISRNHVLNAEALKKKYKLKDGGNLFLLAGRTQTGYQMWICKLIG